jgi:hypothetical protein
MIRRLYGSAAAMRLKSERAACESVGSDVHLSKQSRAYVFDIISWSDPAIARTALVVRGAANDSRRGRNHIV